LATPLGYEALDRRLKLAAAGSGNLHQVPKPRALKVGHHDTVRRSRFVARAFAGRPESVGRLAGAHDAYQHRMRVHLQRKLEGRRRPILSDKTEVRGCESV
jgi:hypothetical protein